MILSAGKQQKKNITYVVSMGHFDDGRETLKVHLLILCINDTPY